MTTLYRFYDESQNLLYVGITRTRRTRLHQHEREKHWWSRVFPSRFEHFATREEASEAEAKAIREERPLHNVIHRIVEKPMRSYHWNVMLDGPAKGLLRDRDSKVTEATDYFAVDFLDPSFDEPTATPFVRQAIYRRHKIEGFFVYYVFDHWGEPFQDGV